MWARVIRMDHRESCVFHMNIASVNKAVMYVYQYNLEAQWPTLDGIKTVTGDCQMVNEYIEETPCLTRSEDCVYNTYDLLRRVSQSIKACKTVQQTSVARPSPDVPLHLLITTPPNNYPGCITDLSWGGLAAPTTRYCLVRSNCLTFKCWLWERVM